MKRLTYRDKSLPRKNDSGEIVEAYSDYDVREIINRLAAYEDTGLEPEEIKELCTDEVAEIAHMFRKMIHSGEIDHLIDLLKAEQEGRLVALPCKAGDIVYAIVSWEFANTPTVLPVDVRSVTIHDDHISVTYGKRINTIGDCGVWGKSVFSSREEAQAALDRRYAY